MFECGLAAPAVIFPGMATPLPSLFAPLLRPSWKVARSLAMFLYLVFSRQTSRTASRIAGGPGPSYFPRAAPWYKILPPHPILYQEGQSSSLCLVFFPSLVTHRNFNPLPFPFESSFFVFVVPFHLFLALLFISIGGRASFFSLRSGGFF